MISPDCVWVWSRIPCSGIRGSWLVAGKKRFGVTQYKGCFRCRSLSLSSFIRGDFQSHEFTHALMRALSCSPQDDQNAAAHDQTVKTGLVVTDNEEGACRQKLWRKQVWRCVNRVRVSWPNNWPQG
jgi:hypothetical protein